jgi:hypothetical protein
MIIYNVRINGTVGTTTTSLATLIAGAVRSFLVLEVDLQGQANASAANELGVYRVTTAGATPSGALTFTAIDQPNMTGSTPALAFSGTGYGAYGTQPVAGALLQNIGLNANGQRFFWRANPNLNNAIPVQGGNNAAASIALFSISGSSIFTGRLQIAEI